MPCIVFVSPKGGAGKTTSALILATQLAKKTQVTVIDADPNHPIDYWAKGGKKPSSLFVDSEVDEENIIERIEAAATKTPFVVVDLEGTASRIVLVAISQADLVIIPTQGSQLDFAQASRALLVIKQQEKMAKRAVNHAVLLTRTNSAIRTRTIAHGHKALIDKGVPVFKAQLNEREAFRAMFSFRSTLELLNPTEVANIDKAIANAEKFAVEVVTRIREHASNS
jgi:chromosome partitioning protein